MKNIWKMLKHVILFMALAISILNSSVNDSCVSEGHEAVTGYDGFIKEAKDICVSSLQAVKDYVTAQVKKKLAFYIRTYLNSAIEPDTLTKGKGASEKTKSRPFRFFKEVKKIAKVIAKQLKASKHKKQSKKIASLKSKSAPKKATKK